MARRLLALVSLLAMGSTFWSCGGGGSSPTAPAPVPAEPPPISASASPGSGSNITWEYGPGMVTPALTPTISWTVRLRAPSTTPDLWVAVRLLNAAGTISCFQSATRVGPVTAGNTYSTSGSSWSLVGTSTFWTNPCGNSFSTGIVDVQLTSGAPFSSSPLVIQGQQFQGTYNFNRTGYTGGPQPTPTPSSPPRPNPTPTPPPPSGPFPACAGSPPVVSCGTATGQCNNNDYTCSRNRSGTCSSNGGIKCVYCPGPIC